MTDNKVEVKDETFYYTEYGYRGLEELKQANDKINELQEKIKKLQEEIKELRQRLEYKW